MSDRTRVPAENIQPGDDIVHTLFTNRPVMTVTAVERPLDFWPEAITFVGYTKDEAPVRLSTFDGELITLA